MTPFKRDRFTWLAYLMLGYYAYMQASLGPLMPFLGTELNLNYTQRAFHVSAFAFGMVLAGLSAARLTRVWSRHLIFWVGGGVDVELDPLGERRRRRVGDPAAVRRIATTPRCWRSSQ